MPDAPPSRQARRAGERVIAKRLRRVNKAITNAQKSADIKALLLPFGYDAAAWTHATAIHSDAITKVSAFNTAAGLQKAATKEVKNTRLELRQTCVDFAKIARQQFERDDGAYTQLQLDQPVPRDVANLMEHARMMFNTTDYTDATRTKLAKRSYNDAKLSGERAKIEALEIASDFQAEQIGAVKQASEDQEQALAAMDAWMSEFTAVATVALESKRQWLNKLGILARRGPTAAQRAAAARRRKVVKMAVA